jgi:hypothetical protein
VAYRLSADFQTDWKTEIGHWLHAAKQNGFLERMLAPVLGERDRRSVNRERTSGDRRHLKLHQGLVAALFCHYFTGLGWQFAGWETETGGAIDIDLALRSPSDELTELQLKVPDQPGDLEDGQYRGGNLDQRVVAAFGGAVEQLPKPSRSIAMVGVFAQRNFSLAGNPRCLVRHLFGQCRPQDGESVLTQEAFGAFMSGSLNHIAGVIILDMLRGANLVQDGDQVDLVDRVTYPCTVLLNPNAERAAQVEWFPKARVLTLQGDRFEWVRGEPWEPIHGLPSGTRVLR